MPLELIENPYILQKKKIGDKKTFIGKLLLERTFDTMEELIIFLREQAGKMETEIFSEGKRPRRNF